MNINTWKRLERIGSVASVGSTKTDTEQKKVSRCAHFFMPEIKNIPLKYGIVKTSMGA